ncbi:hypothetical protein [Nonomuraea cavernae]|uniref:GntR family transcriptional regulator n=1 Tax=Nonomuraea cavernae TaxID=2045107 RepID=A0A917Z127_9ACTN|nr:hypothetical protein [Nonomuraea cavernae]MCA2186156.1 hypothetical protein [Nonomuraea cavernae]GGO70044.1 hypothetical protein GCM10012289_32570 [Nonomuraea cavernae]
MITQEPDRRGRAGPARYQRWRDLLLSRLQAQPGRLPTGFSVHGIAAGLHVLISLPAGGPTEQQVLHTATADEVGVGHLGDRWHAPGDHPQGIIVGYGTPSEHTYPAAVDALTHVLRITHRA